MRVAGGIAHLKARHRRGGASDPYGHRKAGCPDPDFTKDKAAVINHDNKITDRPTAQVEPILGGWGGREGWPGRVRNELELRAGVRLNLTVKAKKDGGEILIGARNSNEATDVAAPIKNGTLTYSVFASPGDKGEVRIRSTGKADKMTVKASGYEQYVLG